MIFLYLILLNFFAFSLLFLHKLYSCSLPKITTLCNLSPALLVCWAPEGYWTDWFPYLLRSYKDTVSSVQLLSSNVIGALNPSSSECGFPSLRYWTPKQSEEIKLRVKGIRVSTNRYYGEYIKKKEEEEIFRKLYRGRPSPEPQKEEDVGHPDQTLWHSESFILQKSMRASGFKALECWRERF